MKTEAQTAQGSPLDVQSIQGQRDRWLFWPAVSALLCVFALALLCGLPGALSFILIPIVVLGGGAVACGLIACSILFISRRELRKAVSVTAVALLPILLWSPIRWAAECAHLLLTTECGIGQLDDAPTRTKGNQFAVYDWSVGLAGGPNTFLIHDPSDEIALPLRLHKYAPASENGFGEECAGRVEHLLGHNYVCTF